MVKWVIGELDEVHIENKQVMLSKKSDTVSIMCPSAYLGWDVPTESEAVLF